MGQTAEDGTRTGTRWDPSPADAGRLVRIYAALDEQLQPFTAVFSEWVEDLQETADERQARDTAVAAAADELLQISHDTTAGWLAAAMATAERRASAATTDESVLDTIDDLRASWRAWHSVADAALATLDTAKRVVLARGLIGSDEIQAFYLQRLVASNELRPVAHRRANSVRLSEVIDHDLANLAKQPQRYRDQAHGISPAVVAREWVARLVALSDCEQLIERHRRSLQRSWERVSEAAQRFVATRHREEVAARHEQGQQEQAARARRLAEEAATVARQIDALARRVAELHAPMALSSRQLRERGWTGLVKRLSEGDRRVPGIPRSHARSVLGFARMTASLLHRHDEPAAAAGQLRGLLDAEDELMRQRDELGQAMGALPVSDEVRRAWGDVQPWLRSTYEWAAAYWAHVGPLLAEDAVEEADALGRVLAELHEGASTDASGA